MLALGADTFILGCTHYPFVLPILRELVGPDAAIIDPAPAVARQTKRRLAALHLLAEEPAGPPLLFTSGQPTALETFVCAQLNQSLPVQAIQLDKINSDL